MEITAWEVALILVLSSIPISFIAAIIVVHVLLAWVKRYRANAVPTPPEVPVVPPVVLPAPVDWQAKYIAVLGVADAHKRTLERIRDSSQDAHSVHLAESALAGVWVTE